MGKEKKHGLEISVSTARDLMSKPVACVPEKASLDSALEIMATKKLSCIVVGDAKGKPKGIITERDMVKKVIAEGKNSGKLHLKDVMTSPVLTVSPSTDIVEVCRMMREKKIRRFPVVEKNKLVGIVTETDIIHGLIHHIKHLNWTLVEEQLTKDHYEKLLKEIKSLANS